MASVVVTVKEAGDGHNYPKKGDHLGMQYTGKLKADGTIFDSTSKPGRGTFEFTIGVGQVIRGWDEGVAQLSLGEVALLDIPSALAYGSQGAGGAVPPHADLLFEVRLEHINGRRFLTPEAQAQQAAKAEQQRLQYRTMPAAKRAKVVTQAQKGLVALGGGAAAKAEAMAAGLEEALYAANDNAKDYARSFKALNAFLKGQHPHHSLAAVAVGIAGGWTAPRVIGLLLPGSQKGAQPSESKQSQGGGQAALQGLQYVSSTHECQLGRRCRLEEADLALLEACVASVPGVELHRTQEGAQGARELQGEKEAHGPQGAARHSTHSCAVCGRPITIGDFGLQHAVFESRTGHQVSQTIRTIPRLWCFPCAKKDAKGKRAKRLQSKEVLTLRERWKEAQSKLPHTTQALDALIK